jgi:hypothetical protein
MTRAHPRWGIEFDWLGVDHHGQVAVFTTAGYGAVPVNVTQRLADVDEAVDQVGQLPVIGSGSNLVRRSADGDYSSWHAYSAKGFYAYDWQVWHGPYQRLSSPTVPVSINQLPEELQAVCRLAVFPMNFADEPEITVEYAEPDNRP